MLPDLESLRCFDAAATRLNFRAAAAQVALSPAAFSDRIHRLEEQLGHALFHRTTRRVTLTRAGERLWPRVRTALDAARACLSAGAEGEAPYELTISTRFELGLSWLVPALERLERAHPERTLHLHFGDSPEMLLALRRGTIDCAVSSARLVEANLRYALLHREAYVLVAAPALLKRTPFSRPEQSAGHRLLDISGDLPLFRYFLDAQPAEERWSFERAQHLGTIGAVRARALAGQGVAVLPRYFVGGDVKAKRLQALFGSRPLQADHFRLVWRKGHPREAQLEQLADELRALPIR